MKTTTRHAIPYPENNDIVGTGGTIEALATKVDDILDIRVNGAQRVARNLAFYEEAAQNLPGYIVIDTNIPFTNHMCTVNIQGYVYAPFSNIMDCTVSFYAYEASVSIVNSDFINNGTLDVESVQILRNNTTGLVSIAMRPNAWNLHWQYPKIWVDSAMVSHASLPIANLKTGWNIRRVIDLTGYTNKKTLSGLAGWTDVTGFENNWTHLDGRRAQYLRTCDGWVKFRGLITGGNPAADLVMFNMPVGFRPAPRVYNEHHMPVASNTTNGYGEIGVNSGGQVKSIRSISSNWVDLSALTYKAGS